MRASTDLVRRVPYVAQLALIAATYFVAARLSLLLAIPPGYATAVWPPSGIALAAALLLGNRIWPGVWIGAALANVTVESSILSAACIASGNTLEAVAGAALIRCHVGDPSRFERGEAVVKFILLCALSATIAATVALLPLAVGHSLSWGAVLRNWWTWWQGDTAGIIIVTPLVLSWCAPEEPVWPPQKRREAVCFGALLLITAAAISANDATAVAPFSLTFVTLPFIIWAAFRFGQREVATAIAVACATAVWYVLERRELFAAVPLNELLLMLLTFISMVVTTGLVLAAVLRERSQNAGSVQRQAEAELRDSESLKSAILRSSLDCLVTIDLEGKIVEFNPAAEATFGFSREHALGKSMADLIVPPRLRAAHRHGFAHYLATGEAPILGKRLEFQAVRADGTEFPIELAIVATRSRSTPLFTGFVRDITERKQAEAKIRRLTRVHRVLSGINAAILRIRDRQELFQEACRIAVEDGEFRMAWIGIVDREAKVVKPVASAGDVRDFFDAAPLAVIENKPGGHGLAGRAIRAMKPMISNDVQGDPQRLMKRELNERGIQSLAIIPLIVGEQAVGVLALYAAEVGFFDEEEMRLFAELAGDVSFALDHIDKAEKVDYLSYYDSLTGLANRTLFHERFEQSISNAAEERRTLALALFDIERFKSINDCFGRQAGDALLKQIAERMTHHSASAARAARIGADQFAKLVPDLQADEFARFIEKRLGEVFGEPFLVNGTELRISARVGIALYPDNGADADTLFRNAEAALNKAKATGERYVFYEQAMTARVAEKLTLENKLRQAIENDEFVLHYQPKVELETWKIAGVEALIRWQSPEWGLVPPMKFIPLLEETGLILQVGSWALRRAAFDHRAWVEQKLKPPRVSVNVSAIQLRQRDFVGIVERAIMEGVAPVGIDLEITESLIMEDIQATIEKLIFVRKLGVYVAIDDFGTGYSSLSYLARLPVEALKIDRSFIITMLEDPNTASLVQTMITLAHSLRLKVVAEGVESEEQAKVLRLLRCDQMQGYLFSKPLPVEALTALLRKSLDENRPAETAAFD